MICNCDMGCFASAKYDILHNICIGLIPVFRLRMASAAWALAAGDSRFISLPNHLSCPCGVDPSNLLANGVANAYPALEYCLTLIWTSLGFFVHVSFTEIIRSESSQITQ